MSDKKFWLTSNYVVKETNEEENYIEIEGYANTTKKDRAGDVITQDAWKNGGITNYESNPIILAFHDHTKPIGKATKLSVNSKGLKIVARIYKSAGNVFQQVKDGILTAFSVGFAIKDADYDEKRDIFEIKAVDLFEISVVSVGENQYSLFSVKKAFTNEESYNQFKTEFKTKQEEEDNTSEPVLKTTKEEEENISMEELESIKAELAAIKKAAADKEAAEAKALAEKAEEERVKKIALEVGASGSEKLYAEIEKRFADEQKSLSEALDGLRTEVAEKKQEIEAMAKSRMSFEDKKGTTGVLTAEEKCNAAVAAMVLGRKATELQYVQRLFKEKAIDAAAGGYDHLDGGPDAWHQTYSTQVEHDVREKLVVAPLFRNIPMQTPSVVIPTSTHSQYGEWIATSDYKDSDSSTGTDKEETLGNVTLTAHKLAAKEYIGYEETEDSIIPLIPLINDAISTRISRTVDRAHLIDDAGVSNALINGVATLAEDAGVSFQTTVATSDKIRASDLQAMRRQLGTRGLEPGQIKYVVSQRAYYDLLEDPDFRTVDLVGADRATILKGHIGNVAGSPVIVSGEFATTASGTAEVVCVYTPNFVRGTLRNLLIERDKNIEHQKNIIVATQRIAFTSIFNNQGASVILNAA